MHAQSVISNRSHNNEDNVLDGDRYLTQVRICQAFGVPKLSPLKFPRYFFLFLRVSQDFRAAMLVFLVINPTILKPSNSEFIGIKA